CSGNSLTKLDVSNNSNLKSLFCGCYGTFGYAGNQLTSIDISHNIALEALDISINQITSLDLSNNINLKWLNCAANHLSNLDISANTSLQYVTISNLPSLHEVCVWTTPFPPDSVVIDITGSPSICFETDCNGVCDPADVEDLWIGDLSIYPNPTYTLLSIETITSELIVIEITSLNGKLILSKELEGTSHQLDLSSFQKGVYIITIRSKDFITTRKVVKL
ncbi:MAG: T9SS type A sorting domain-containing protein, partial [Bacteroidales bacterium]